MQKKISIPKGSGFLPGVSKKRLKAMHREAKDHKAKSRLSVYIKRKNGEAIREIERSMLLPYSTVRNWLVRAVQHGLDGMYDQKRDGRKCKLSDRQLKQPRAGLIAGPQKCGSGSGVWTSRLVVAYVKRKFGVRYAGRGMYDLLRRIGFSSKKPRPRHPKAASGHKKREFKKKLDALPDITPKKATR